MSLSPEKNKECQACEFEENIEILREIYFFSGLPMEVLKVLAYLCNRETFKQNDYLFQKDDDDSQAFYIITGKCGLLYTNRESELLIREYGQGEFLGGLALLGNLPRLYSLKALSALSCLILDRDKFSRAMQQFPELIPKMFKGVVRRIYAWENRLLVDYSACCESCKELIGVSVL
ncbi:MAG: Crp/Fnr family transcriptional regulator [Desulfobacterales bacterium]|nr:Crp/Fnr family transcriptional regulator [Desulfobacterales bacterium]